MSRIARSLIVLVGALALVVPTAANAAPADPTKGDPARALVGRWVGTFAGYYNGEYVTGGQKIVITNAKGHVAKGTWQSRETDGRWSAPLPVQFVVHVDEDVDVWGQDAEGYYDGELRGDRLVFSYASTQPAQAYRFVLTRR